MKDMNLLVIIQECFKFNELLIFDIKIYINSYYFLFKTQLSYLAIPFKCILAYIHYLIFLNLVEIK